MNVEVKKLAWLVLPLFILTTMFGAAVSSGVMTQDGKMQDCPYMGISTLCKMDVSEHLATWQQLFSPAIQQSPTLLLLALLSFVALQYFSFYAFVPERRTTRHIFNRWREAALFGPLRLAFSRGIIHSKEF
jgi:hypothetical protein